MNWVDILGIILGSSLLTSVAGYYVNRNLFRTQTRYKYLHEKRAEAYEILHGKVHEIVDFCISMIWDLDDIFNDWEAVVKGERTIVAPQFGKLGELSDLLDREAIKHAVYIEQDIRDRINGITSMISTFLDIAPFPEIPREHEDFTVDGYLRGIKDKTEALQNELEQVEDELIVQVRKWLEKGT